MMRYFFTAVLLLLRLLSGAQCVLTWEYAQEDGGTRKFCERTEGVIKGIDGFDIRLASIDSFTRYLDAHPFNYDSYIPDAIRATHNDSTISAYVDTLQVLYPESAKVFRCNGRDVARVSWKKLLVDGDTVMVHKLQYCDNEWSEDCPHQTLLYAEKIGIIKKCQGGGFNPTMSGDVYWLAGNTCLPANANTRMKKLVALLRNNDW